jgi:hypothetical protein
MASVAPPYPVWGDAVALLNGAQLALRLNLLYESRSNGAQPPLAQDIADHLFAQTMPQADTSNAPTTDKVELSDPPVQTSARVARKAGCLRGE